MAEITPQDQKVLRKLTKLIGDLNEELRTLHETDYCVKVTKVSTKQGHENLTFNLQRVLK